MAYDRKRAAKRLTKEIKKASTEGLHPRGYLANESFWRKICQKIENAIQRAYNKGKDARAPCTLHQKCKEE
jgi:hypothetical protein